MDKHTYENCHNLTCRRKERNFGYNQALEDLKINLEEEKKTYAYNGYSLDTDKWLDDYLNSKLG